MRAVSIESTLLLFLLIQNSLALIYAPKINGWTKLTPIEIKIAILHKKVKFSLRISSVDVTKLENFIFCAEPYT